MGLGRTGHESETLQLILSKSEGWAQNRPGEFHLILPKGGGGGGGGDGRA